MKFLPNYGRQAYKHEGRFKFFGGVVIYANGGGAGLVEAEYKAAATHGVDDALWRARHTSDPRQDTASKASACSSMAPKRNSARARWCSPAAASRRTANGARAISGRVGTWRRCAAPATTPATASAWRSTSARSRTANGRAAMRSPGSATPTNYGDVDGQHSAGYRHSYPFGIMVNADGERFVDEGADFRNYTYAKYGRAVLAQPGSYAWQVFDCAGAPSAARRIQDARRDQGAGRHARKSWSPRMQDVNPAGFLKTIREFNAAVTRDVTFDPNIKDGKRDGRACAQQEQLGQHDREAAVRSLFGRLRHHLHVRRVEDRHRRRTCWISRTRRCPGFTRPANWSADLFYFNYPGSAGLMAGVRVRTHRRPTRLANSPRNPDRLLCFQAGLHNEVAPALQFRGNMATEILR